MKQKQKLVNVWDYGFGLGYCQGFLIPEAIHQGLIQPLLLPFLRVPPLMPTTCLSHFLNLYQNSCSAAVVWGRVEKQSMDDGVPSQTHIFLWKEVESSMSYKCYTKSFLVNDPNQYPLDSLICFELNTRTLSTPIFKQKYLHGNVFRAKIKKF